jgi:hypothetical protein
MTVIVNETATSLSTAGGFYRVESYQNDFSGTGTNQVSTGRKQQTMTFSNAGNCRGIILGFQAQSQVNQTYSTPQYTGSVVVGLHEAKTMTVTIASPAVVTSTGHGLSAGQEIQFSTTGALPTGITATTTYYVISTGLTLDTFRFSTSLGGSAVNTSGSQSGTHTLWVVRATKTRTVADITNNAQYPCFTSFIKPFKFDTPVAVDTTPNKYRFQFYLTTTSTNYLVASMNAALTSYSYFAWCDTTATFSSGNDTVIATAPITIDQTATFKAISYTTISGIVYGMCGLACSPDSPNTTYLTNGMFVWQTPTLASYTLTLDGMLILATQAGFHVGNPSYSIPIAKRAIIKTQYAVSSTSATAGYSGLGSPQLCYYYFECGATVMMYGEVPAQRKCTLTADAAVGVTTLSVDDSTGFTTGDVVYISKQDGIRGVDTMASGAYTVSSAPTSTSIAISPAIATIKRLTGGYVIKALGYGILYQCDNTSYYSRNRLDAPANFICQGVAFRNQYFIFYYTLSGFWDDIANLYTYPMFIDQCVMESYQSTALYNYWMNQRLNTSSRDAKISNNYFIHQMVINAYKMAYASATISQTGGDLIFDSNIFTNHTNVGLGYNFGTNVKLTATNNISHNCVMNYTVNGTNSIYTGNYGYGCQYGIGMGNAVNCTVNHGNTNDRMMFAIFTTDNGGSSKSVINCSEYDNTYTNMLLGGIRFYPDQYMDYEIKSPTGNLTSIYLPLVYQVFVSPPSYLRITNSNDVSNADYGFKYSGNITRTGTGLADTTVHTSGGFAMRMESISSTNLLEWVQNVPTGNIQNKDMSVGVWCKLNSANYYAGTCQMPRLTVTYDDGTVVYAEAAQSTDWQYLQVPFRPLTTAGQITVSLNTKTSATTTDAYVYWDDMSILYPAGSTLALGSLDLWNSGYPVMPTISTLASAQDVWAVDPTNFGSGTVGSKVNTIDTMSTLGNFL